MDPAHLQPGYRLDRYELLCPLAYGGMASVWLARFGGRLGFERLVALKMVLPQYSQDPRFQEMFLDEARIASRIEHPNVARILDVGEHGGSYFIVMEWVDGDSLSKVLRAAEQREQSVPAGIGLRVCADAAAGLHAAHELKDADGHSLGVVHRDVSPQNILISNTGATMVIDFGVAKTRDRVSQDTSAGQLKGKIRYMAPEQAIGSAIDRRADVWGLGVIAYEVFAGVAPYQGANEVATLHNLTSGAAPTPLPRNVPAPVEAVIMRALAFRPDERYATALELSLALETAMVEIGDPTSTKSVASYCAGLLEERKASRRRAVEAALAAARTRDAAGGAPPPSLGGDTIVTATAPPAATTPLAFPAESSTPASGNGHGEQPSLPSETSSATLGSAAVVFPPALSNPFDHAARRRRYFVAAVLGVSLAAGIAGAVLLVGAAVGSKQGPSATGLVPSSASTTAAPPPAAPDPIPEPAATALAASASTVARSAIEPRASATPSPSPHRPTPQKYTPPKPAPTPSATTPRKPDYGF